MNQEILALVKKERWELVKENEVTRISAYGQTFKLNHPISVHLKMYRTEKNPDRKYYHMKAVHDYLWPDAVWHYWTERRFKAHCNGWNFITYAGGASCAKSRDAAVIAIIFWLANPVGRTVIVASTSLESLGSRIWGYVTKLINKMAIKLPYNYLSGNAPKILYPANKKSGKIKDTIHGMFAVAAKQGDDETVISSWIGRHPDEAILVILDESTDMPPALTKALPNLEQGVEFFQCMAIGNSNSKYDLHGALSTPKAGWNSIDPMKDTQWETTQKNGICLFFSCYESPAIHETNEEIKKILGKFLITKEQIEDKEKLLGKYSDSFWRFVLGFWRSESADETVISKNFIETFDVFTIAEWSGIYPLHMVAGLDPAFSTGGDSCVLRAAILGQTVEGNIVLDFRGNELLFKIPIIANTEKSADLQIADFVIEKLRKLGIPLNHLCIDANGQGRALGEVIKLRANSLFAPIKIYSVRTGNVAVKSFDVKIVTSHELWFSFRDFIQHKQIKGVDSTTINQLTSRLVIIKGNKQVLESKKDYKNRMGAIMPSLAHSPDEADAAALCLQSAIINYGFTPGQRRDMENSVEFGHDKFWVYKQILEMEKEEQKEGFTLEANFTGLLEDVESSGF